MPNERQFTTLAEAVADGQPLDWGSIEQSTPGVYDREALAALRDVAQVGDLFASLARTMGPSGRPPERLEPGAVWGGFRIIEHVGSGRYGDVYRAWDPALDRRVALKLVGCDTPANAETPAVDEGRLMARVRHPNVVAIYGAQRVGDVAGLSMEFVEGRTLEADLVVGGPAGGDDLARLGRDLAAALGAVHAAGLVHRDVKTSNVLIESSGRVVLGDFGTGRELDVEAAGDGLVGTPAYVAPEIFAGAPATPRSDVYSLGVLLFRLATGEYPQAARTLRDLRDAHETQAPRSLRDARPDLPPVLTAIVDRALSRDPAERFGSGDAMARAFEDLRKPTGSRRRSALAGVAAGLALALVGWLAWSSRPAPFNLGPQTRVTSEAGLEIDPAFSPDGRLLAYSTGVPGRMRVKIRDLTSDTERSLDAFAGDHRRPVWSPDSRHVLVTDQMTLRIVGIANEESLRTIRHTSQIRSAIWNHDGSSILFTADASLYRVAPDSGGAAPVRNLPADAMGLALSHDETRVAFVTGNQDFSIGTTQFANIAPSAIQIVNVAGGPALEVAPASALNVSPVWSGDDRRVWFISDRDGARDIHEVRLDQQGGPLATRRITTGLGAHSLHLGADGVRLAYSVLSRTANVWSVGIPASGEATIEEAVQHTTGSQVIETYAVSRDGRWLYFASDRHGNADLFRQPLAGTGAAERLTDDPNDEFVNDLSGDGETLAYHAFRNGRREVRLMSAEGGQSTFVSPGLAAKFSPDGDRLVVADVATSPQGTTFRVLERASGLWSAGTALGEERCTSVTWRSDASLIGTCGGVLKLLAPGGHVQAIIYAPSQPGDPAPRDLSYGGGDTVYFKSYDAEHAAGFWAVPVTGGAPRLVLRLDDQTRRASRTSFWTARDRLFFALEEQESSVWTAAFISFDR